MVETPADPTDPDSSWFNQRVAPIIGAPGPDESHDKIIQIDAGWWLTYPSEKYELDSWDYEIPNIWKHKKCINMFQTTNQDASPNKSATPIVLLWKKTISYGKPNKKPQVITNFSRITIPSHESW